MRAPTRSSTSRPGSTRAGVLRLAVGALTLTLGVGVGTGGTVASAATGAPGRSPVAAAPDPLADADHTVEQLRREADAASGRYFDALARMQTTEREIADLEARIPVLEHDTRRLRDAVRARRSRRTSSPGATSPRSSRAPTRSTPPAA